MKKRIRFVILSIIIIFFVFLYAHISKCNPIYNADIDSSSYNHVLIYDFNEVRQRFICKEDKLNGISIKSRVMGDVEDITVRYSLWDVEDKREVANGKMNGQEFKDSKFAKLMFQEVTGCKGKEFEIKIQSTGENSNNIIDFYYEVDAEKDRFFYQDDNKIAGTLILKTVTNRFDWETFCVLLIFVVYICGFMKFLYKLFE